MELQLAHFWDGCWVDEFASGEKRMELFGSSKSSKSSSLYIMMDDK